MKEMIFKGFPFLIFTLLFQVRSSSQLFPAFPREIKYKEGLAYFGDSRFTGMLVDEKTNMRLGEFQNGYKNGNFIELFDNGKKKSEGVYSYGANNGLLSQWYENGIKKSETDYTDGKANGYHKVWYETGLQEYVGSYINGLREGICTEFFSSGKKKHAANYLRDKLNGQDTEWYESGQKKIESSIVNELKQGEYRLWFENGQLQVIYKYNQGNIVDGKYLVYTESGEKEKEETYVNGVKTKEGKFKDGNLYEKLLEYYNGTEKKKSEGISKNGYKDSLWTEWYDNGQIESECNYLDGKRSGKCSEWYSNGDKKIEALYETGELSKILYENKVDPANSIKSKLKSGSFLFSVGNCMNDETSFIMVDMPFKSNSFNERFKYNIIHALETRFHYIAGSEVPNYYKNQLRYSIEITQPEYSTVYDDGNSSTTFLMAALNVHVAPGYRGQSDFSITIKDLINNRTISSSSMGPRTNLIYTSKEVAFQQSPECVNYGVILELYKTFKVKAQIIKTIDKNKKGIVKSILINVGQNLGLSNKYTLRVYNETNLTQSLGLIEIIESQQSTAICKILIGGDSISELLNQGKTLYAILTENLTDK